MIINTTNNRGVQPVAETETITVSKRFADNLRELAYLLDDKRSLNNIIDEHCGWVLTNLVEVKASTVGEWADLIDNIAPWETEAECRAFVDRVRPKFEETAIFDVYEKDDGKWDVAMFDSRWAHWRDIWHHCRRHGIEFEEARKAFLRGELQEFLVSQGTTDETAAALINSPQKPRSPQAPGVFCVRFLTKSSKSLPASAC